MENHAPGQESPSTSDFPKYKPISYQFYKEKSPQFLFTQKQNGITLSSSQNLQPLPISDNAETKLSSTLYPKFHAAQIEPKIEFSKMPQIQSEKSLSFHTHFLPSPESTQPEVVEEEERTQSSRKTWQPTPFALAGLEGGNKPKPMPSHLKDFDQQSVSESSMEVERILKDTKITGKSVKPEKLTPHFRPINLQHQVGKEGEIKEKNLQKVPSKNMEKDVMISTGEVPLYWKPIPFKAAVKRTPLSTKPRPKSLEVTFAPSETFWQPPVSVPDKNEVALQEPIKEVHYASDSELTSLRIRSVQKEERTPMNMTPSFRLLPIQKQDKPLQYVEDAKHIQNDMEHTQCLQPLHQLSIKATRTNVPLETYHPVENKLGATIFKSQNIYAELPSSTEATSVSVTLFRQARPVKENNTDSYAEDKAENRVERFWKPTPFHEAGLQIQSYNQSIFNVRDNTHIDHPSYVSDTEVYLQSAYESLEKTPRYSVKRSGKKPKVLLGVDLRKPAQLPYYASKDKGKPKIFAFKETAQEQGNSLENVACRYLVINQEHGVPDVTASQNLVSETTSEKDTLPDETPVSTTLSLSGLEDEELEQKQIRTMRSWKPTPFKQAGLMLNDELTLPLSFDESSPITDKHSVDVELPVHDVVDRIDAPFSEKGTLEPSIRFDQNDVKHIQSLPILQQPSITAEKTSVPLETYHPWENKLGATIFKSQNIYAELPSSEKACSVPVKESVTDSHAVDKAEQRVERTERFWKPTPFHEAGLQIQSYDQSIFTVRDNTHIDRPSYVSDTEVYLQSAYESLDKTSRYSVKRSVKKPKVLLGVDLRKPAQLPYYATRDKAKPMTIVFIETAHEQSNILMNEASQYPFDHQEDKSYDLPDMTASQNLVPEITSEIDTLPDETQVSTSLSLSGLEDENLEQQQIRTTKSWKPTPFKQAGLMLNDELTLPLSFDKSSPITDKHSVAVELPVHDFVDRTDTPFLEKGTLQPSIRFDQNDVQNTQMIQPLPQSSIKAEKTNVPLETYHPLENQLGATIFKSQNIYTELPSSTEASSKSVTLYREAKLGRETNTDPDPADKAKQRLERTERFWKPTPFHEAGLQIQSYDRSIFNVRDNTHIDHLSYVSDTEVYLQSVYESLEKTPRFSVKRVEKKPKVLLGVDLRKRAPLPFDTTKEKDVPKIICFIETAEEQSNAYEIEGQKSYDVPDLTAPQSLVPDIASAIDTCSTLPDETPEHQELEQKQMKSWKPTPFKQAGLMLKDELVLPVSFEESVSSTDRDSVDVELPVQDVVDRTYASFPEKGTLQPSISYDLPWIKHLGPYDQLPVSDFHTDVPYDDEMQELSYTSDTEVTLPSYSTRKSWKPTPFRLAGLKDDTEPITTNISVTPAQETFSGTTLQMSSNVSGTGLLRVRPKELDLAGVTENVFQNISDERIDMESNILSGHGDVKTPTESSVYGYKPVVFTPTKDISPGKEIHYATPLKEVHYASDTETGTLKLMSDVKLKPRSIFMTRKFWKPVPFYKSGLRREKSQKRVTFMLEKQSDSGSYSSEGFDEPDQVLDDIAASQQRLHSQTAKATMDNVPSISTPRPFMQEAKADLSAETWKKEVELYHPLENRVGSTIFKSQNIYTEIPTPTIGYPISVYRQTRPVRESDTDSDATETVVKKTERTERFWKPTPFREAGLYMQQNQHDQSLFNVRDNTCIDQTHYVSDNEIYMQSTYDLQEKTPRYSVKQVAKKPKVLLGVDLRKSAQMLYNTTSNEDKFTKLQPKGTDQGWRVVEDNAVQPSLRVGDAEEVPKRNGDDLHVPTELDHGSVAPNVQEIHYVSNTEVGILRLKSQVPLHEKPKRKRAKSRKSWKATPFRLAGLGMKNEDDDDVSEEDVSEEFDEPDEVVDGVIQPSTCWMSAEPAKAAVENVTLISSPRLFTQEAKTDLSTETSMKEVEMYHPVENSVGLTIFKSPNIYTEIPPSTIDYPASVYRQTRPMRESDTDSDATETVEKKTERTERFWRPTPFREAGLYMQQNQHDQSLFNVRDNTCVDKPHYVSDTEIYMQSTYDLLEKTPRYSVKQVAKKPKVILGVDLRKSTQILRDTTSDEDKFKKLQPKGTDQGRTVLEDAVQQSSEAGVQRSRRPRSYFTSSAFHYKPDRLVKVFNKGM